MKFIKIWNLY